MTQYSYAVEESDRATLMGHMATLSTDAMSEIDAGNRDAKRGITASPWPFSYSDPNYTANIQALVFNNTITQVDGIRSGLVAPSLYDAPVLSDTTTFSKSTYDQVIDDMNVIFGKSLDLNPGANPERTRATAMFDNNAYNLYYDNAPTWITGVSGTGFGGGETLVFNWTADNKSLDYRVHLWIHTAAAMTEAGTAAVGPETLSYGTHAYTVTGISVGLYSVYTPMGNIEFQTVYGEDT